MTELNEVALSIINNKSIDWMRCKSLSDVKEIVKRHMNDSDYIIYEVSEIIADKLYIKERVV